MNKFIYLLFYCNRTGDTYMNGSRHEFISAYSNYHSAILDCEHRNSSIDEDSEDYYYVIEDLLLS